MERLVVAAVLLLAALLVAAVIRRRSRRSATPTRTGWTVPDQLDRADFTRPDAPWLVVLFSSASCDSCAGTWEKVRQLDAPAVAVQDVSWQTGADLHTRYAIEAVPSVLVADAAGVVRASFLGPPSAADLWAAVSELRDADAS